MTVIRNITLDSNNPYALGKFWEAVLGWPMGAEYAPGDGEVLLEGPEGLPGLLIIEVPEPKSAKSRMHFDLQPQTTRDEELARVLALGAKVVEDHRKADGKGWVWCEDPEGKALQKRSANRPEPRPEMTRKRSFACLIFWHLDDCLTCGNPVSETCSAPYRPRLANR